MKRILKFILMVTCVTLNAQETMKDLWKKVNEYEQKGKPESAIAELDKIYKLAQSQNNTDESIHALIYKFKFKATREENSRTQIISETKTEIAKAKSPLKNVLQCFLARNYWAFYNENSYKFDDRTALESDTSVDIETWSLKKIEDEARTLFLASIAEKDALLNYKVTQFDNFIYKGVHTPNLRSTLYEVLAYEALEVFFKTSNPLPKPIDDFRLDKPEYINLDNKVGSTTDLTSHEYWALKIYESLAGIYTQTNNEYAKAELAFDKQNFVLNSGQLINVNEVRLQNLLKLQSQYSKTPTYAKICLSIAQIYENQGQYVKAIEEATKGATFKSPSPVNETESCKNVISNIKKVSVEVLSEKTLTSLVDNKVQLKYRNTNQLYVRIYKTDFAEIHNKNNTFREKNGYYPNFEKLFVEYFKQKTIYRTQNYKFISNPDYGYETTELILPKLESGMYYMVYCSSPDFDSDKSLVSGAIIQASSVFLTHHYAENNQANKQIFKAFNRSTGEKISSGVVHVYSFKETPQKNYSYYTTQFTHLQSITANAQGEWVLEASNKTASNDIVVQFESTDKNILHSYIENSDYKDNFYLNTNVYDKNNYTPPQEQYNSQIYTDRALYRPGQTIFFKGIVQYLESNSKTSIAYAKRNLEIRLLDANEQEISKQTVTTNEFGSYAGNFTIPLGLMNGGFTIADSYNSKNIQVEEYVRPKFFVELPKPQKSFLVNEDVTVTGIATAYNTSAISNAKVSFTVKRITRYPVWYYNYWFRCFPQPSGTEQIIAVGNTVTKPTGNFDISFKAIPDASIEQTFQPVFDYKINCTVTDLNGESQSTETVVSVGFNHYELEILGVYNWEKDSEPTLSFSLTNVNKIPQKGKVQLKIEKFKYPQELYRTQLWAVSSKPSITSEAYKSLFAFDPYTAPKQRDMYELEKVMLDQTFEDSSKINLKKASKEEFVQGLYKFTATTQDPTGKSIKSEYWAEVSDFEAKIFTKPEMLYFDINTKNATPGQKLTLKIGTSLPKAHILKEVFDKNGLVTKEQIVLKNELSFLDFKVPSVEENGSLLIRLTMVHQNRIYTAENQIMVRVPQTEKPKSLQIKVSNFRSTLLPGIKEQYSVHISANNTDKNSELLALMYDASLDAIVPYTFEHLYRLTANEDFHFAKAWSFYASNDLQYHTFFSDKREPQSEYVQWTLPSINWFGFRFGHNGYYKYRSMASPMMKGELMKRADLSMEDDKEMDMVTMAPPSAVMKENKAMADAIVGEASAEKEDKKPVQIRKNLQETAFFFPQLHTDSSGSITLSFTSPEALTKWNVYMLAHNKEMISTQFASQVVTKKELMLTSNMPRFMRENDLMTLSFKISNTSEKQLSGVAKLILKDALTLKEINAEFHNLSINKAFSVDKGANTEVSWNIKVPEGIQAVIWTATAETDTYSDGEEAMLPVLSPKELTIASLPLYVRGGQTKTFEFEHFKKAQESNTLRNHKMTVEFTTQPAWYAVQALPYLMQDAYESNLSMITKFYANALARHIVQSDARIKTVFETWKNIQPEALMSNLEKNQDLKYLMLQETPWVTEGKAETTQKRQIGLLFDESLITSNLALNIDKLKQNQLANGAWTWFDKDERYPDRYITLQIVHQLARLLHIKALSADAFQIQDMLTKAQSYLDSELEKDYQIWKQGKSKEYYLNAQHVYYFYARQMLSSAFTLPQKPQHYEFFMEQVHKYAFDAYSNYLKACAAIVLHNDKFAKKADELSASIKEHFIKSEEFGIYFKESYQNHWYARPIETQCMVIELFQDIYKDSKTADELKIWLLKQKQTMHWGNSTATTDAVYTLLKSSSELLSLDDNVTVKLGRSFEVSTQSPQVKAEAGTGYVKTDLQPEAITKDMDKVTISKTGKSIAWGAVTWQYFENIDKVKPNQAGIAVTKEYYKLVHTASGDQLQKITDSQTLEVGDEVRVRLVVKTDRAYNYVMLKDHRPAGAEPVTQVSGYAQQDGLWYYQSMKDAASLFFMSYLDKGTHVFEYSIKASRKGEYAAGYACMQCMYAPEFNGHSQGLQLKIK